MKRVTLAAGMNALVPGVGLVVLGRPRVGVAVAVWFGLAAETAICGVLIAPAAVPEGASVIAACLAGAAWVVGQGLLAARVHSLRDPHLGDRLAGLRRQAEEALARGDDKAARWALLRALSIDDSALATRVLWARLLSATATPARARRAWMSVARLDTRHDFSEEIRAALGRLGAA